MKLPESSLQVHPGQGLVANLGSLVAVILPTSEQQLPFVAQLLGRFQETVAAGRPGVGTVRAVAALVAAAPPEQVPSFGLLVDTDRGLGALLYGSATLTGSTEADTNAISLAAPPDSCLSQLLVGTPLRLDLGASPPTPVERDELLDLRDGTVPGSALTLWPGRVGPRTSGTGGAAETVAAATTQAGDADLSVAQLGGDDGIDTSAPAVSPPSTVPPASPVSPAVSGEFVSVALSEQQTESEPLPLPGAAENAAAAKDVVHELELDDGNVIRLDKDYLIGREPETAPAVQQGEVEALPLHDEERLVSRVHARVGLWNGLARIRDEGSSNGTTVLVEGQQDYVTLTPHLWTSLPPGSRVRLGGRELSYRLRRTQAESENQDQASDVSVHHRPDRSEKQAEGIADYRFVRSLGQGNQGEFFLATTPARLGVPDEYVAVKVLAGETSDEAFRRVTTELRTLATVDSPYLVSVYDAGQDGGRFFYSIPYFSRGTLASPREPLSFDEVVLAVAEAARGAHALHEAGVAHQGIKPENILLGEKRALLSDLGLAQLMSRAHTVIGLGAISSIEYLDPELLRGAHGSRGTDIWALAATLHRALTGLSIYGELPDDPLLAVRTLLSHRPVVAGTLDPRYAELIRECLGRPDGRPLTALAFAERLETLLQEGEGGPSPVVVRQRESEANEEV